MNLQIEASWNGLLKNELEQNYFLELREKVKLFYQKDQGKIFPKKVYLLTFNC